MNNSCGQNCMTQWYCCWCKNLYCHDTSYTPYHMIGKPKYWSEHEQCKLSSQFKKDWNSYTEKQRNRIRKKYASQPEMTEFLLCYDCKNKYIENNICKGRHKNKIENTKKGYYW